LKSQVVKSRFADEDLYFKHQTLDSDDGVDVKNFSNSILSPANPTGVIDGLTKFFPVYSPIQSCACPVI
jgi:hypothetical protein